MNNISDNIKLTDPIDQLNLTYATNNALKRAKIFTISELLHIYNEGNLGSIKGLGDQKSIEILDAIKSLLPNEPVKDISEIKDISVNELKISRRLQTVLMDNGYTTVGSVLDMTPMEQYCIIGVGNKSISELRQAVVAIKKEGLEYFKAKNAMTEPVNYDKLRDIDVKTANNLVENYSLNTKQIAGWYGFSVSRVWEILRKSRFERGNWLNRTLTENDCKNLNNMVDHKMFSYADPSGGNIYLYNNLKDDCAVLFVNEKEIKCFYLSMLPEAIQDRIRVERLECLSPDEYSILSEGQIVSILRKEYFRPKDAVVFARKAKKRGMKNADYCIFLTGLPLLTDRAEVTDERITKFLQEHYKNGKIVTVSGESTQWFRSFIYRHGYTVKDIAELYGL